MSQLPSGNIFRFDPQPPQQTRYAPIPKQGDPPPKAPLMMPANGADLIVAWRDPDPMPYQRFRSVVPIFPSPVSQPPLAPLMLPATIELSLVAWRDPDPMPYQRFRSVVPKFPTVSQPPLAPIMLPATIELMLVAWRDPDPMPVQKVLSVVPEFPIVIQPLSMTNAILSWQPPDPMPTQKLLNIVSLTLPTGQQPPILGNTLDPQVYNEIMAMAWQPPDPQPQRDPKNIVTLTLPTGQQPPTWTPVLEMTEILTWQPPPPEPWQLPLRAVLATAPAVSQPPRFSIVNAASTLVLWREPDPMPTQKAVQPVTLSLPTGQQPPPRNLWDQYSIASWQPPWTGAQAAPPKVQPFTGFIYTAIGPQVLPSILAASQPPDPQPYQKFLSIPSLPTGQQPPPRNLWDQATLQSWQLPWTGAQSAPPKIQPGAAYVPVGPQVLPSVYAASLPPDPMPLQKVLSISPTFPSVSQPPTWSIVLQTEERWAWEPPPPDPTQLPLKVAPLTLTYGQQPPPWSIVIQMEVRGSWEPPPPEPHQLPLVVAPLTLTYGQQPPRFSIVLMMETVGLWQPPPPQPPALPSLVQPFVIQTFVPVGPVSTPLAVLAWFEPPPWRFQAQVYSPPFKFPPSGGIWIEPFRGIIWDETRGIVWIEDGRGITLRTP